MANPGAFIYQTVTGACTLGFVPVAIHFELFQTMVMLDKSVSAAEVVEAVERNENIKSPLNLRLAEDTLFIMAGLGLIDMVEDKYQANAITKHMVSHPSSIHGALHFTYEGLLASAFIYPQLLNTNFSYPFKENTAPFQYAHSKMGNAKFASQHLFATMHEQGRLDSFNYFMEGKFGIQQKFGVRAKALGYDLDAIFLHHGNIKIVDIGGGQGEWLLELRELYPGLKAENLILQEFNADAQPRADITVMDWDFKGPTPQPVVGADVYNLMHICHNTPDLEVMQLLRKLSAAMGPKSRLWIQEFTRSLRNSNMHTSMIAWFGGGERSEKEWKSMAEIAGLRVTFQAYAERGEGLIEMMKI